MITSKIAPWASLAVAILASAYPIETNAQQPKRQPTPNDTLKSPEVDADRKVTFRVYAPKATDVSVSGDFGQSGKLTKDERGVWSITLGPLDADYYSYIFNIDGVRTVDPKNPEIKQGANSLESMFLVPGADAEFETTRDVPHGEIRSAWYRSSTLNSLRRMHVYTPPGYERGNEKYPVFYLLHGGGDEDSGWSTIGRAGFIIDNLLADKKVLPFLVVMPNGSLPRPANLPRITPGAQPSPEARAAMESLQNRFTDELLKEVVPFVESHYRVRAGAENRALAGLSMGGGQTLRVLTTHPDQFAYVGIWSAGIGGGNSSTWEERNSAFLSDAEKVNRAVKLLSIRVGDQDFALPGSKALIETLEKHKIQHEFQTSGGGHTWRNWRHYLNQLAPRLFR
jgi:enterochelin esterase family protein